MSEEETKSENEEETSAENEEDLWAAAADDLAQQREMLRDTATSTGDEEQSQEESATAVAPSPQEAPPMERVPDIAGSSAPPGDTDRIMDIPMQVSVELGRTRMLINDLLQLGQGSVIELTKLVGEPLEVLVNNRLVAKGEVVVVNEKFGIRITEISAYKERIKSFG